MLGSPIDRQKLLWQNKPSTHNVPKNGKQSAINYYQINMYSLNHCFRFSVRSRCLKKMRVLVLWCSIQKIFDDKNTIQDAVYFFQVLEYCASWSAFLSSNIFRTLHHKTSARIFFSREVLTLGESLYLYYTTREGGWCVGRESF